MDAVAGELGETGRWFHYGLDVVRRARHRDRTAGSRGGELLVEGLDRCIEAVVGEPKSIATAPWPAGRTGMHAEPITFGAKLAGWAFELDRDRTRLLQALETMRVGKLAGAVGTYGGGDPEVERVACERLGLHPSLVSTQVVPRDRHAELLSTLALCAARARALCDRDPPPRPHRGR